MQDISIQSTLDSHRDLELERKHHARLFHKIGVLLLVVIPFLAIGDILTNWLSTGQAFNGTTLLMMVFLFLGTSFSLYVNHQGNYHFAVNSFLLLGTLSLNIVAINAQNTEISLIYFALLLIIGKPLLSKRGLFLLTIAMILDIYALSYLGFYSMPVDVTRLAIFISTTYLTLYVITLFRDDLEAERRYLLEQNQRRLQWTIRQLPAAIWTIDLNMQAQLFESSYSRSVMTTSMFNQFIQDETIREKIVDVQQKSIKVAFEYISDENTFRVYIDPMYDRLRRMIGCTGIIIDVTEQKLREEYQIKALLEQERIEILTEFLASASHDLRTPLSSLQLSTYLLKKTDLTEKQVKHVERIDTTSTRFANALDKMFTLVHLNLEKQIEVENYDIARTVSKVVNNFRSKATKKHIQIDFSNDARLMRIDGNEERITTALGNLMQNALDNTPPAGTISVHMFNLQHSLMIEIRDSGTGIPHHELPKITQAFYRVQKHRPDNHVGLGLTISQKIIEQHHGSINIRSTLKVGTYVQILLPLSTQQQVCSQAMLQSKQQEEVPG